MFKCNVEFCNYMITAFLAGDNELIRIAHAPSYAIWCWCLAVWFVDSC